MMKLAYGIIFLTTLILDIWQVLTGGNLGLIVFLAIACGTSLVIGTLPIQKWGCSMISTIWRAWRHPKEFFFIQDVDINLLPSGGEPGKGFEWACKFQVVSVLPWSKTVYFKASITDPEEIAGTNGSIPEVRLCDLSKTDIPAQRLQLSEGVHDYLVNRRNVIKGIRIAEYYKNYALPITLIIEGRDRPDHKGKLLIYETINQLARIA